MKHIDSENISYTKWILIKVEFNDVKVKLFRSKIDLVRGNLIN